MFAQRGRIFGMSKVQRYVQIGTYVKDSVVSVHRHTFQTQKAFCLILALLMHSRASQRGSMVN